MVCGAVAPVAEVSVPMVNGGGTAAARAAALAAAAAAVRVTAVAGARASAEDAATPAVAFVTLPVVTDAARAVA